MMPRRGIGDDDFTDVVQRSDGLYIIINSPILFDETFDLYLTNRSSWASIRLSEVKGQWMGLTEFEATIIYEELLNGGHPPNVAKQGKK